MASANLHHRFSFPESNRVPPVKRLAERVRHYFDQHPEVSREEFLVEAVRREMYHREHNEIKAGSGPARRESRDSNFGSTNRSPLSAEDIRVHAWLMERLAVLHHERHGLWPRLRRFLFGHRSKRLS